MQRAKEVIKQVKRIEISTKKQVEGLITGNYHSVFKGQGIDFSEIREYRAGLSLDRYSCSDNFPDSRL